MPSQNKPQLLLQSMLLNKNGHQIETLQQFLNERPETPQDLDNRVVSLLSSKLKQATERQGLGINDMESAQVLLQVIQHLSSYEQHPKGLQLWINQGLHKLINIFLKVLHYTRQSTKHADTFFVDTLETITSVADYSTEAKEVMVEEFANRLLQVVTCDSLRFTPRIESLKTLNLLLERCPISVRNCVIKEASSHEQNINRLGALVANVGDYEFQVSILEVLFRLTNKAERLEQAKMWFRNKEVYTAFTNVRESEFETDCRTFINTLNASQGCGTKVYSVACNTVLLGKYALQQPDDTNYKYFWVDFNTGSKRISIFCGQDPTESQEEGFDEGMWETVSIWDENVLSYTVQGHGNVQIVQITLKDSARNLISYGPQFADKKVFITFMASSGIILPLMTTFGQVKCEKDVKKKCSAPEYPVHLKSKASELKIPETVREEFSHQGVTEPVTPKERGFGNSSSQRSCASTLPKQGKKVKVSVPCVPMTSPASMCTPHSARSYKPLVMQSTSRQTSAEVSGESKGVAAPKTPTGGSQKRVRTPLKMVEASNTPVRQPNNSNRIGSLQSAIQLPLEITNGYGQMDPSDNSHIIPAECIDPDEIVPSSYPDEHMIIPESQDRSISEPPKVTSTSNKERGHNRAHDSSVSDLSKHDDIARSMEKEQRQGQMAALKHMLTATDPNYVTLPINVHKVSNTPALSTVSEESNRGSPRLSDCKATPKSTQQMSTIPEMEDDLEQFAECTAQTQKTKTYMSPDSSTANEETRKRTTKSKVLSKTKKVAREKPKCSNKRTPPYPQQQRTDAVSIEEGSPARITRSTIRNQGQASQFSDQSTQSSTKTNKKKTEKKRTNSKCTKMDTSSKDSYSTLSSAHVVSNQKSTVTNLNKRPSSTEHGSSSKEALASHLPSRDKPGRTSEMKQREASEESDSEKVESSQVTSHQPKFFKSKLKASNEKYQPKSNLKRRQPVGKSSPTLGLYKDKDTPTNMCLSDSKSRFFKSRANEEAERDKSQQVSEKIIRTADMLHQSQTERLRIHEPMPTGSVEDIYDFEPNLTEFPSKKTPQKTPKKHQSGSNKQAQGKREETPKVHESYLLPDFIPSEKAKSKGMARKKPGQAVPTGGHKDGKAYDSRMIMSNALSHIQQTVSFATMRISSSQEVMNPEKGQKRQMAQYKDSEFKASGFSEPCEEDTVSILDTEDQHGEQEVMELETEDGNEDTVARFAKICQGLVQKSESRCPRSRRRCPKVNYKDLTESEVEEVTPAPKVEQVKSVKRASIDPYILDAEATKAEKKTQQMKRKHKSVFSETEDNMSVRSELSWLGSTARRKKKKTPVRAYNLKNKQFSKPKLRKGMQATKDGDQSDNSAEESNRQEKRLPPKLKKGAWKRKKVCESLDITRDEESDLADLYYDTQRQTYDIGEDTENRNSKGRLKGSKMGELRCPEKTPIGKDSNQRKGKAGRQPLKNSTLSNISIGEDVEQMRFENSFQSTPYMVVDSPYRLADIELEDKLPDHVLDGDVYSDELVASQGSYVTHTSSLKTPKDPEDGLDSEDNVTRKRSSFFTEEMRSGPSKKRRVQQPFSTLQTTDSISDRQTEMSGENDQDEDIDSDLHNKSPQMSESFMRAFLPRKLFEKADEEQDDDDDNDDDDEKEEEEEDKDFEDYSSATALGRKIDVTLQSNIGSLIQSFGTDLQRNVQLKKRRLEQMSKGVVKSTNKQVAGVWNQLQSERQMFFGEFQKTLVRELSALEEGIMKVKEAEDKGLTFFQVQLSVIRQCNISHSQRVQRLKKVELGFVTGVQTMEHGQTTQQGTTVREGLRREMQNLQKKMLQRVQHEEMMNMKRTLSSLFL